MFLVTMLLGVITTYALVEKITQSVHNLHNEPYSRTTWNMMTMWLWLRILLGVYTMNPSANYLEHDDHVALVENIAIGVYCVHCTQRSQCTLA